MPEMEKMNSSSQLCISKSLDGDIKKKEGKKIYILTALKCIYVL